MDVRLWGRVVWRFRWISALGLLAACSLAVLSTARLTFVGGKPQLTYREAVIYTATARVLVTQAGFPWGRTVLPSTPTSGSAPQVGTSGGQASYADPSRFEMLAVLYAALANGDDIQRRIVDHRLQEVLTARGEIDPQSNSALPVIDLISLAPSRGAAVRIAAAGAAALRTFVTHQQTTAQIPQSQRVLLQTLQQPLKVTVATPRKKTTPIVVFATVLLATLGLVFALENLRPRLHLGGASVAAPQASGEVRFEPSSPRQTA
jgi:hypothetical protein